MKTPAINPFGSHSPFKVVAGCIIALLAAAFFFMDKKSFFVSLDSSANKIASGGPPMSQTVTSFYDLKATSITGTEVPFSQYKNKVVLIVNTASACGFTPQYKGMEELYQKFHNQGFVILGFPSNQFGAQESGSDAEIQKFCELRYKVTFPMFKKSEVKGPEQNSVYKYLTKTQTDFPGAHVEPKWNFNKYLINKQGKVVGYFESKVEPLSSELVSKIEDLVKE